MQQSLSETAAKSLDASSIPVLQQAMVRWTDSCIGRAPASTSTNSVRLNTHRIPGLEHGTTRGATCNKIASAGQVCLFSNYYWLLPYVNMHRARARWDVGYIHDPRLIPPGEHDGLHRQSCGLATGLHAVAPTANQPSSSYVAHQRRLRVAHVRAEPAKQGLAISSSNRIKRSPPVPHRDIERCACRLQLPTSTSRHRISIEERGFIKHRFLDTSYPYPSIPL